MRAIGGNFSGLWGRRQPNKSLHINHSISVSADLGHNLIDQAQLSVSGVFA